MLPGAIAEMGVGSGVFVWVLAGFAVFFALEQLLHWHHCDPEYPRDRPRPLTYLVLLGDGLHNLLGLRGGRRVHRGRAPRHQRVARRRRARGPPGAGDFAVLLHGGWERRRALLFNFLSALTFLVGGLLAYTASLSFDVAFLLPFAAGNFIYIAASDLVPEVKQARSLRLNLLHFTSLTAGIALLYLIRVLLER